MLKREHYLKMLRPFYDGEEIKVLTGLKQCGKSVLLEQIREELTLTSNNIILLRCAERAPEFPSGQLLLEYITQHKKPGLCYVLLDDVQNIPDWLSVCLALRQQNYSLFLTGSKGKILTPAFTQAFADHYLHYQLHPFVYKEIADYAHFLHKKVTVANYLIYGGLPRIYNLPTKDAIHRYIKDLKEKILSEDLEQAYQVKNTAILRALVNFVLRSNGSSLNLSELSAYLSSQQLSCSSDTLRKYLRYLEETSLITYVKPPVVHHKKPRCLLSKAYDEDVVFYTNETKKGRIALIHNLENIVHNELRYRGYQLYTYQQDGHAVDFLAVQGTRQFLVQTAFCLAWQNVYTQKLEGLAQLKTALPKYIISNDSIDYSTANVTHYRLREFLLRDQLEK